MSWQRAGALSGVASAILFGVAFIVFLAQGPTGSPRIPDIANAGEIAPYIEANGGLMEVQVLLSSLAIVLFLWFLGALWTRFGDAESERGRVVAVAGGIVGAGAVLGGLVFLATALLVPVEVSPLPYVLGVVSIGLGGAAFTIFFAAAAKVILDTGALHAVIGYAAILAAVAAAIGFATLFADSGIFNAATGAFGYWVRFSALVLWLALAGGALAMTTEGGPRRRR